MKESIRAFLNTPFKIGALELPNRLIQGPLAGFSCAPFRELYYQFLPPAYCVSEMISAYDVLYKHKVDSRYLYRAPQEKRLCYQLSGADAPIMSRAAERLQALGADLIDINCGCPKIKIRKKGAGSALLEKPEQLSLIVAAVREAIEVPLTIKIRIGDDAQKDVALAIAIEAAGADALIIHGRRWTDDYTTLSNLNRIRQIKQAVRIPVIANGDIVEHTTLENAITNSACDAYMISRAGSGKPWLYQQLLSGENRDSGVIKLDRLNCFLRHLHGLTQLENEYQAVLQSRTLIRFYYKTVLNAEQLQIFYGLNSLAEIEKFLRLLG